MTCAISRLSTFASRRRTSLAALLIFVAAAGSGFAAEQLGTLTWDASNNVDSTNQWTAINGTASYGFASSPNRPTRSSADPTRIAGISTSYIFDGNDSAISVGNPDIYTSLAGDPTNDPASFEIWFKPDSLSGGNQVLLDLGGSSIGSSLTISDGQLRWRTKDNSSVATIAANLPTSGDFIQAIGTVDTVNHQASLYINGVLAAAVNDTYLATSTTNPATSTGVSDWDGGDAAGLGSTGSALGGNNSGDLNSFSPFAGQIAILRFHEQTLSAKQALNNYNAVTAPAYASAVLDSDPIAYWRLGERQEAVNSATSGGSFAGLGGAVDGSYVGSPSILAHSLIPTDPHNHAVRFDGVDDHINVPNSNAINASGPYTAKTFELLFSADDVDTGGSLDPQVLYEQGGATNGFNLFINDGLLHTGVWVSGNFFEVTDAIAADTTYHVASVWDNGTLMLYVDGALIGSVDTSASFTSVPSHAGGISIGASNGTRISNSIGDDLGPKYFFAGTLDELALYNTALSSATIANHAALAAVAAPTPAALPAGLALLAMLPRRRRRR